ncbi:3-demethylubiquinone-9 3-methyltransferase [Limimonas halophila]|uniref:Ubiquinone biosynthesis O-methyltransferase n=1 Tax=Limimonas halophila TaxID=1082479 RepID=A0A1G7PY01_9PROT|nr:bifunctional 2-polyprenyl-6-hydroxyphenol methylase/3-demethylubiquinol 3-O-methyltransferase UbiG [Limimonas halophila]SDF91088.1 3-demethylubiquinone-9 3-methyltransferase [Limimonas halophila]
MTRTAAADAITVNPDEVAKFARMASDWWDPEGEMKPLHALNPTRIAYIRDHLTDHFGLPGDGPEPLKGLRLLDVGCGGGLLAEPLARLGAQVTGLDATVETIKAAKAHAQTQGLTIDYRCTTAEAFTDQSEPFDAVLALEVVEHVADRDAFLRACGGLVRPGGLFVLSTINRTRRSFLLAKVAAEYILGWLPRGTHDWRSFVRPSEVAAGLRPAGLHVRDLTGVVYTPFTGGWTLSRDTAVNYMLVAEKP